MSEQIIEERLAAIRAKADKYATAKATMEQLSEFRKSKLAILMKEAAVNGHTSAAAQEREALASPQYQDFLQGYKAAIEAAEALRWSLQIDMAAIEIWRTRQSTRRAEMTLR